MYSIWKMEAINIMKTSDFYYELPEGRIAQHPLDKRDNSKLLFLDRSNKTINHHIFQNLPELLRSGDCLVVNNTKVLPVRLYGIKEGGGAKIELLLLEELGKEIWRVLAYRAKRLRRGTKVVVSPDLMGEILTDEGEGVFQIRLITSFPTLLDALEKFGHVPLPPYIERDPKLASSTEDMNRYQTVYAKHSGSAAAPTAGFHFTPELLNKLEEKGITTAKVTLHVGLDTFKPIIETEVEQHKIHSEIYRLIPEEAAKINQTRASGGRIIAVGTTSVRVLETCAKNDGEVIPRQGKTSLYIMPGYKFKTVDGMITNFHLPETTLLVMIASFIGSNFWKEAYQEAIENDYRFYSYGDAMFIL